MAGVKKGSSSRKGSQTSKNEANGKGLKTLFLCINCEVAINEKDPAIECHGCLGWSHKKCSNLTEIQYEVLEDNDSTIQWFCTKCKSEKPDPNKSRLEAKIDLMMKMVHSLDDRMKQLEEQQAGRDMDQMIQEKVDRKVEELFEEQQEREKRKRNIIIVNLEESKAETAEERQHDDMKMAKMLVSKATDEETAEQLEKPVRLGKFTIGNNRRPRLLRLTFKTEQGKRQLMKNVHKINEGVQRADDRKFINNDLTPKEREKYRELKEELKDRTDKGEEDLIIREGKIVKRPKKQGSEGQPQNKQKGRH